MSETSLKNIVFDTQTTPAGPAADTPDAEKISPKIKNPTENPENSPKKTNQNSDQNPPTTPWNSDGNPAPTSADPPENFTQTSSQNPKKKPEKSAPKKSVLDKFFDDIFSSFRPPKKPQQNSEKKSDQNPETPAEKSQEKSQENPQKKNSQKNTTTKKSGFGAIIDDISHSLDSVLSSIFPSTKPKSSTKKSDENSDPKSQKKSEPLKNQALKDQIKTIINLPDTDYSDSLLTSELRAFINQNEKEYQALIADYKSHIAPSYREHQGSKFLISGLTGKGYYVQSFPSFINALRTRDIFSFRGKRDLSFFVYPEDDSAILSTLKQKSTQLRAELKEAQLKGVTIDTEVEQQYKDVELIRQKLTTREERYFELGLYANLYHDEEKKLPELTKKFEQKLAGYGIRAKPAIQRMDESFASNLPLCQDELGIVRSAVTSSLAGSFPFISDDLVDDSGILYGVNTQTGGLVIFDRFKSGLANMNSVVLATSGAGKSFTVKLEALRYLLTGIDVIIIDPENEYKNLCDKAGGTYINIATNAQQFLNPFDVPPSIEDVEYGPGDLLRSHIMNLIGMISILIGKLSPEEEAILDRALQNTYTIQGFSFDATDYSDKTPPRMADLMASLEAMDGGEKIALRLSKFVDGTFWKIFNNATNIDINNQLTVFSIRDLEDALKTPAMFNILNFLRTKVRSQKKKRLIIIDEARILLQNDVSANFLFSMVKRARKYGVGVSTISQDIEDFVRSQYGKPIISNSSVQILLKQSPSSIKQLESLIGLSQAEQQRLVSASIGEGLIFAGQKHIGVKILASPLEKSFITTDVK